MSSTRTKLSVTTLESREVPANFAFGQGWANAESLTLSFAPDGTTIGELPKSLLGVDSVSVPLLDALGLGVLNGVTNPLLFGLGGLLGGSSESSNLNNKFGYLGSPSDWQREILRAFQSWASVTNLNIGLVADAGTDFGAAGDLQADRRFGDIRIGGKKLSSEALATAVQTDDGNGTWSGDVLFNTSAKFRTPTRGDANAYDLFSAAAHEAGHTLGLHHSDNPDSVLSERYTTRRTGLGASDIAAVRSYYGGARRHDSFDAATRNETAQTASAFTANSAVVADLTTTSDVDNYGFTVPAGWTGFTAKVRTSGLSLLGAKLTVVNAAGQTVGSDVSTNPANGDLDVRVNGAVPGGKYFLRVESATADVFGIGRYQLSVSASGTTVAPPPAAFPADGGTNDNPTAVAGTAAPFEADGRVEAATDFDFYRLSSAAGLTVTLRRLNPKDTSVSLAGFDSAMNRVEMEVVSDDGATLVARLPATANGQYLVRVSAHGVNGGSGYYHLTAAATGTTTTTATVAEGTLTTGRPAVAYAMNLENSALIRYSLDARTESYAPGVYINLAVVNSAGQTVLSLRQAANGNPTTASAYVAAGRYTLQVSVTFPILSSTSAVDFALVGGKETDPIGTYKTTTGSNPGGGGGTGGGGTGGGGTGGGGGGSSGGGTGGGSLSSNTTGSTYTY